MADTSLVNSRVYSRSAVAPAGRAPSILDAICVFAMPPSQISAKAARVAAAMTASKPAEMRDDGIAAEGYIKVSVRLRPLMDGRGEANLLQANTETGEIVVESEQTNRSEPRATFKFGSVFDNADNLDVFRAIGRPLVESVMVGYNATLFAYGQVQTAEKMSPALARARL